MMTEAQAHKWARQLCEDGTYATRTAYRETFGVGKIAERFWDDPLFTHGIEYGILIAVVCIYGRLPERYIIPLAEKRL